MLSVFFGVVVEAAAILVLLPVIVLFGEIVLAVVRRKQVSVPVGERPSLAVLMPAHDEASLIVETLRSIAPQLSNADRLIVIADNCSDATAAIAAEAGAEVVVRVDSSRRGKGYALDFGVSHLKEDPRDVVVIIDADCQVATGAIDRLARHCRRTARPVQALYLMRAPMGASLKVRIAEFACVVKNQVRPTGLMTLGMPCQLMGTGMAFPWECLRSATLATGNIVEDLKLGIDLTRAGTPPVFCPNAFVASDFPTSASGVQGQRARWEHGHLATIVAEAPRLFLHAIKTLDANSMALALDLAVPPLALLALLVAGVWFAAAVLYLAAHQTIPLLLSSISAVMFTTAILLSWARYGRAIVSFGNLAFALVYSLWKIPLYVKFLVARQMDWVRSKRSGDEDG